VSAATGVFPGLAYDAYARMPGLRSSYLRLFRRSALHARMEYLHPRPPTRVLDLGSAIHCAVFEPEAFESRYVRGLGIDRRSNANKAKWAEFEAAHAGKGILDWDDWATAGAVREAVWSQPWAAALLGGKGSNELSVGWRDPETMALCKARVDRFAADFDGFPTVCDLKSTRNAERGLFVRDIAAYDYHLQAAFYLDGLDANASRFRQWLWIVVEKHPPYGCALYMPDEEMLEAGRVQYRAAIERHLQCERERTWPGYSERPQIISLPAWARPRQIGGMDATQAAEAGF
jgi:hypothetical protein